MLEAGEQFLPRFYEFDEYIKLPRLPSKWLIEGLIPTGYTNIYANPKIGKSFLALGICEAICSGSETYEGFNVLQHGPVAYLQIDTPREEWADRYAVIKERLKGRKYPFFTADMWTVPCYPFNLLRKKQDAAIFDANNKPITEANWLKDQLTSINPILLVVDTLRDVHEEDEDKSGSMRRVLGELYGIVGQRCSIILVSHSRKDSQYTFNTEDDIMQGGRGSNAVAGKMDMVIRMTKKEVHTKGRAKGYKKYSYHQIPEGEQDEGRIVFDLEEKAEKKASIHDIIAMLVDSNAGLSKNQLAIKLAALTNQSERTAHRRIDEWQTHQQARAKAQDRLQQEVEHSQPEFLHLPNGNRIHLPTGEELPPEFKPKKGLWNEPLNL